MSESMCVWDASGDYKCGGSKPQCEWGGWKKERVTEGFQEYEEGAFEMFEGPSPSPSHAPAHAVRRSPPAPLPQPYAGPNSPNGAPMMSGKGVGVNNTGRESFCPCSAGSS